MSDKQDRGITPALHLRHHEEREGVADDSRYKNTAQGYCGVVKLVVDNPLLFSLFRNHSISYS